MKALFFLLIVLFSLSSYALSLKGLVRQDGKKLESLNLNKNYKIVSFFFSNCSYSCIKINSQLKSLHSLFSKEESLIDILSITVDPENDTPKVLKKYSKKWTEDAKHWWFVTGRPSDVFDIIKNEFKIEGGGVSFVHSEQVFLYKDGKKINTYSLFEKKSLKALKNKINQIQNE